MYKIGDTFISKVLEKLNYTRKLMMYYVLVRVDSYEVALIGLNSWNKWSDSVKVKHIHAITDVEFKEISSSGKFKRCNKEEAFKCLLRECMREKKKSRG